MSSLEIIAELKAENALLKHRLRQLEKMIFGSKSERFKSELPEDQLSLFAEEDNHETEQDTPTEQISYERKKKKHPGRNPFPDHLPVEEITIEPLIDTKGMTELGKQITQTLKYTPASLIIQRITRQKYLDKKTGEIHIGVLPSRPIPKSIAEASLLSHILVSKYIDHLPLYRIVKMFARDFGWKVSTSTMNDWVKACCHLLDPLYNKLKEKVLENDYIQADESPIKVLENPENSKKATAKKIMQGYQWVYHAPELGLVYINYRNGRGHHGPKEVLKDYTGYVQCDGYGVYDKIAKQEIGITLVGCMAHARRKFSEAKESDKERSEYVLSLFQKIYAIERSIRKQGITEAAEILKIRQEQTKPLMEELKKWIDEESIKVLPKSPIGKAMYYYQAQWNKLKVVYEDGRLEVDNNLVENKIRPLALGRKNYLFAGSHEGAKWIAMMLSFFGSCKQQGVNPSEWMEDTLNKISEHPINRIEELLPGYEKSQA